MGDIESRVDEAQGRAKKAAGEVTDDKDLQREGKLDKAKSKVKGKAARAKDKAQDLTDRAAEKLR
jgi:uncharacterized protein YjbJ (UPF0337 family)